MSTKYDASYGAMRSIVAVRGVVQYALSRCGISYTPLLARSVYAALRGRRVPGQSGVTDIHG